MQTLVMVVASIMVWVVALTPLGSQAGQEEATSVVVNIQHSADEVSAKVLQDLTTRIAEMVTRWEGNLQKTLALHEQVQKGGTPAQAGQSEDQLSRTMQQAGQNLAEILAQRDAARTGLDKLEKVIADGSKFFQEQGRKVQAEHTKIADDLKRVETRLRDLAELRCFGVSIAHSSQVLVDFAKAGADFSRMVQQTQGLVQQLADFPLPGDLTGLAPFGTVELKPAESLKILKSYLDNGRQGRR